MKRALIYLEPAIHFPNMGLTFQFPLLWSFVSDYGAGDSPVNRSLTMIIYKVTAYHYSGQCPKWFVQRSAVFDSFYLSVSEVVDYFSILAIMKYINATGCLNTTTIHQIAKLAPSRADEFLDDIMIKNTV